MPIQYIVHYSILTVATAHTLLSAYRWKEQCTAHAMMSLFGPDAIARRRPA